MQHIGGDLKTRTRKLIKPRYTLVFHDIRERLGINISTYVIFDSIHKLSHTNEQYVYCTMSKKNLGKFLGLTERTIFRAINKGLELAILEKNDRGDLRTTRKWGELVEIYSLKET